MNKSSTGNKAVRYTNADGENTYEWFDWKTFLGDAFKPVKAVRKYHHFRFSSLNPGVVFVKETSDPTEAEVPHQLLRRPGTVFDGTLPQVLPPGGLSVERQAYLYKSIRPFVREAYKDTLCPRAHEE